MTNELLNKGRTALSFGDWIYAQLFDNELAIIHEILPRKTLLKRKESGKKH